MMLKLLSSSSCIPNRIHITALSGMRTGSSESITPLLRVLKSRTMFTPKSRNLGRRALFCTDTSEGSEHLVEIVVKDAELGAQSRSSSAIVPANSRTEDYLKVVVGWLPLKF